MKRQTKDWEEICVNHTLDKEPVSRIYEELYHTGKQQIQGENGQKTFC